MSRLWRFALLVLIFLVSLVYFHSPLLRAAGDFLVHAESPRRAQAAVVLAGDWRGDRVRYGAELVKQGYVPRTLVSGPMLWYGLNEADVAVDYAVRLGYPREGLEPVYIRAMSTEEEAKALLPLLRKRALTDVLIVTSNYHTRRSGEIFRRILPKDIRIGTIAVQDPYFDPSNWWHRREGQKTFFYEATKTIAVWMGL